MLLALETATNVCSVAFYDEEGNVFEKRTEKRGSHSEQLFIFIQELMDEQEFQLNELEGVLISEGPGSYTGLRIGASAVKGLLFMRNTPLYGVNTLASFAMQAVKQQPPDRTIHSIIDARRTHVYHQKFSGGDVLVARSEVEVIPIKTFEKMVDEGDVIIGTGLQRIGAQITGKAVALGEEAITARSLISLFKTGKNVFFRKVAAEHFEPKYYTSNQVR